jgi:hypothetical protein
MINNEKEFSVTLARIARLQEQVRKKEKRGQAKNKKIIDKIR